MEFTRSVRIVNTAGLHARPCHAIVQTAMGFPCSLRIRNHAAGGDGVNGKSILQLMTLEASQGAELELSVEGDQGEELLASLLELIESGFGES